MSIMKLIMSKGDQQFVTAVDASALKGVSNLINTSCFLDFITADDIVAIA